MTTKTEVLSDTEITQEQPETDSAFTPTPPEPVQAIAEPKQPLEALEPLARAEKELESAKQAVQACEQKITSIQDQISKDRQRLENESKTIERISERIRTTNPDDNKDIFSELVKLRDTARGRSEAFENRIQNFENDLIEQQKEFEALLHKQSLAEMTLLEHKITTYGMVYAYWLKNEIAPIVLERVSTMHSLLDSYSKAGMQISGTKPGANSPWVLPVDFQGDAWDLVGHVIREMSREPGKLPTPWNADSAARCHEILQKGGRYKSFDVAMPIGRRAHPLKKVHPTNTKAIVEEG